MDGPTRLGVFLSVTWTVFLALFVAASSDGASVVVLLLYGVLLAATWGLVWVWRGFRDR